MYPTYGQGWHQVHFARYSEADVSLMVVECLGFLEWSGKAAIYSEKQFM